MIKIKNIFFAAINSIRQAAQQCSCYCYTLQNDHVATMILLLETHINMLDKVLAQNVQRNVFLAILSFLKLKLYPVRH